MNDILFDIIRVVVFSVFLFMCKYLLPLAKKWINERISQNQYELIVSIINEAVKAAEQEFKGQSGQGQEKKAQVVAFVTKYCMTHGLNVSSEQISLLIEAAVYAMNMAKESRK